MKVGGADERINTYFITTVFCFSWQFLVVNFISLIFTRNYRSTLKV